MLYHCRYDVGQSGVHNRECWRASQYFFLNFKPVAFTACGAEDGDERQQTGRLNIYTCYLDIENPVTPQYQHQIVLKSQKPIPNARSHHYHQNHLRSTIQRPHQSPNSNFSTISKRKESKAFSLKSSLIVISHIRNHSFQTCKDKYQSVCIKTFTSVLKIR